MAWNCGLLSLVPAPDSLICAQANGIIIGAFKTAAADLMAQVSDSESDFDLKRNLLFFLSNPQI